VCCVSSTKATEVQMLSLSGSVTDYANRFFRVTSWTWFLRCLGLKGRPFALMVQLLHLLLSSWTRPAWLLLVDVYSSTQHDQLI
jgi:hypothetical protein